MHECSQGTGLFDSQSGWKKNFFPQISLRMTFCQHYHDSEKDREKGSEEGGGGGTILPKTAGSQQQQPTPVGRHRKGEEGGGGKCVDLCVYLCVCGGWRGVGCAVKALMCAPCSPQAFPFVVGEPAGPSAGAVPGESSHHIPFPLFQAFFFFYEQSHPQVLPAFLPAPDVLSFHLCR